MPPRKTKKKANVGKSLKLAQLRREIKYGRNTLSRAEKEWKALLNKISVPKFREELILTWHYYERVVDMKDFMISILMDEVRSQEDAYLLNLYSHQNNIETMMELFSTKLHEIYLENNEMLKDMFTRSLEDLKQQTLISEDTENYMKVMSFGLEIQRKRAESQTKTENFAKLTELASKNFHDNNKLLSALENKLLNTWNRIRSNQTDYFRHRHENKKLHDAIKEVDENNQRKLKKELKKLMNLKELAKLLTNKFNDLEETLGQKLDYLESENESLYECCYALRNKLKQDQDNDAIKRSLMTVESAKLLEYLIGKSERGEKMVKMLSAIRKYETLHQKILPYPCNNSYVEDSPECIPQLRLFWNRMAEVQSSRFALHEESVYLKIKNEILRKKIHEFCQCLDCPIAPPIPFRAGKIPYTEGTQMIRNHKKQSKERLYKSCLKVEQCENPNDDIWEE